MRLFRRAQNALGSGQSDVDPHTWRLPSSYSTVKPGAKQTVIPSPSVFSNTSIPHVPDATSSTRAEEGSFIYPDISDAAVHLALLECFRNLRLSASKLNVKHYCPPTYGEASGTDNSPVSNQGWDTLIRLATARFSAWWNNVDRVLNHASGYSNRAGNKAAVQLSKDYLPPLDVLLVWYALILKPEAYRAACRAREPRDSRVERLCFPWPAIRDVVNREAMRYELPKAAQNLFNSLSSQEADILVYLEGPPAYVAANTGALPSEIDLFTLVRSHDEFIDAAHDLLWIRSPALSGSLSRMSAEYFNCQLNGALAEWTRIGNDASFGIELFWRTHQLFPEQYEFFQQKLSGIKGGSTSAADQKRLGKKPATEDSNIHSRTCFCWTCERIRDDLPTFLNTFPGEPSSSSNVASALTQNQLSSLSNEQLRQIQDDLGFYKAAEKARASGKPLPVRPPTKAEREAERIALERQKEAGLWPGLHEYVEVMPDGTERIRKQSKAQPYAGLSWSV